MSLAIQLFDIETTDGVSEEQILQFLQEKIYDLLLYDYEKLVNIMYRIDVSEQLFHQAHNFNDLKTTAAQLAVLVWDREIQKRNRKAQESKFTNCE